MNKNILYSDNDIKIYSLDYLINNDMSEEDLHCLFDTKSLKLSFIINMFKLVSKHNIFSIPDIMNEISNKDKWYDEHKWCAKLKYNFRKKLIQAYQNIYQYSEKAAKDYVDWFLFRYGFKMNLKEANKYVLMLSKN